MGDSAGKPLTTADKRLNLMLFWERSAQDAEIAGVASFRRAGEYRAMAKALAEMPAQGIEAAFDALMRGAKEQKKDAGGVN